MERHILELERENDELERENDFLRTRNAELEAENGRLREAVALANSMIRSGECMSKQAEGVINKALSQKAGDLEGGGGE